jgi:hypothetical protein
MLALHNQEDASDAFDIIEIQLLQIGDHDRIHDGDVNHGSQAYTVEQQAKSSIFRAGVID